MKTLAAIHREVHLVSIEVAKHTNKKLQVKKNFESTTRLRFKKEYNTKHKSLQK